MGSQIRHLFLPSHTNNFRSKLLHYETFAILLVGFFIFTISFKTISTSTPDILGYATNIHIKKLLLLTNQERVASGFSQLVYNDLLAGAAAKKAEHMFQYDYWAHNAPDGTTPWDFITDVGYVYSVAGENLAKNFSESSTVIDAWMNSPTHRENLLRQQYSEVGFAIVDGTLLGEDTTLVVQMFGKRTDGMIPTVTSETEELPPSLLAQESQLGDTSDLPIVVSGIQDAVVKRPVVNIAKIPKPLMISISLVFLVTVIVDGVYVWRRKVVRVSGRNFAHVLFLFMLTGTLWYISIGSIL